MYKIIIELVVALLIALVNNFKVSPEELERMKVNEKTRTLINFINNKYVGYELPVDAKTDKWGNPTAKT